MYRGMPVRGKEEEAGLAGDEQWASRGQVHDAIGDRKATLAGGRGALNETPSNPGSPR